jgi:hypothetical protein
MNTNTCKVINCESTELVYSGTDAFMLGINTETYCYNCANAYAQINRVMSKVRQDYLDSLTPVSSLTTSD